MIRVAQLEGCGLFESGHHAAGEGGPVFQTYTMREGRCPGATRQAGGCLLSQPWIHRLALQGQDAEATLVDPAQRLPADEALQGLDP